MISTELRPFCANGVTGRRALRAALVAAAACSPALAAAQVHPECQGVPKPAGYDEQVQQDFLANYVALGTTFSPIHAPVPHEPGRGAIGLDLNVLPPLGCERRFVLDHTKTEDTNKTPVVPRPRVTFAFPALGPLVFYAGAAWVPPVPVFGTRNSILSAEIGVGSTLKDKFQLGGRVHATSHKTVADIATAFDPADPPVDDLFIANTLGVDAMFGYVIPDLFTPYAAIGFTDASTFFYIGDDGIVTNNLHPYAGATFSLGLDGLAKDRIRYGAELYGAPGGYSLPDDSITSVDGASYGKIYTARVRIALEL